MRRILVRGLAAAISLWVVTRLPLGIQASSWATVLWAAVILGLVNLVVRPVVRLLALPLNLLTLGLFGWVINGLMLKLVSLLVPGFVVPGFWPAIWGAVAIAIISGVIHWLLSRVLSL
ncbi:MAG: phage holin family protein [Firmicutes bacterium]|nr:phage holin family protein [Bacillota bacterium]